MNFRSDEYVEGVLGGEIVVGELVRLAVERHVRDLTEGEARGIWFDEVAAKMAIAFFGVLRHWKGEWAGRPVVLEPWQQFFIWNLFGWKREDGFRRFRTCYLEVARKNGKTTLAAGIGLYLMVADGEPGAEVYTAATKRDQARIAHKDAAMMVKQSPQLKKIIRTFKDNLSSEENFSKFEPLGRDADSTDGLNVHGVIADEVHAWKDGELWDKLETATGSRRQPLLQAITTAGYDRQSLCYQLHDYGRKILNGIIEDDSYLPLIFGLDEEDDWEDEGNWPKANPNLGVSKKWDDVRGLAARAKNMPARLNSFLQLHLNVWTEAANRWIHPDKWRACGELAVNELALAGRRCYGGLDLSSNIDVSAFVLVFPPESEDEPYWVVPRFFIPEDNVRERVKRDRVPFDAWIREGLVIATPGNVIDYDWVLHEVGELMTQFNIGEVGFDSWGATMISQKLMEMGGDEFVVKMRQGFATLSPPMKELEKLVLSGGIAHGNHPVLSWMADNLVARMDPAGNLKPDKEKSVEKIDGMVALIMGLDRAVHYGGDKGSVYSGRGIRVL